MSIALETLQTLNSKEVKMVLDTEDNELIRNMQELAHAYFLTGKLELNLPLLQLLFRNKNGTKNVQE